jgi:hypothetical protein
MSAPGPTVACRSLGASGPELPSRRSCRRSEFSLEQRFEPGTSKDPSEALEATYCPSTLSGRLRIYWLCLQMQWLVLELINSEQSCSWTKHSQTDLNAPCGRADAYCCRQANANPQTRRDAFAPEAAEVSYRKKRDRCSGYQRSAAVCTGASHSRLASSSSAVTVSDAPAISSEVVWLPTSVRATTSPSSVSRRRAWCCSR